MEIILASASPRRRELLPLVCAEFTAVDAHADETLPAGLSPQKSVMLLARRKAEAAFAALPPQRRENAVVIGADTLVWLDGEALGKPRDDADAARMLHHLSGRIHTVTTGVALCAAGRADCFCESTDVEFYPLCESEIASYIAAGEPRGKAGAYAIQGAGALLVKRIDGDFYNVIGLPVAALKRHLAAFIG